MFQTVLVANRGAIACRIIRTLRKRNIRSIAVYSEPDAGSLHTSLADDAICIGPGPVSSSYLNMHRIIGVALEVKAEAVHPGYGFLSENAEFAQLCEDSGLVFLGPTPDQIRAFGLKNTAREIALTCGAPILPGSGLLDNVDAAIEAASRIRYPVMLKSVAGGGGIGMRRCDSQAELVEAFESVRRLSENNFKNSGVFLERFVSRARHIEVQIFGDGHGEVVAIGERDCSVQRRNQKVIEEAPAPHLTSGIRESLHASAINIARSVDYRSAGTVEFLYDADTEEFFFLEVNSRLQVEHGVTEEVFGIDLVDWMIRLGEQTLPPLDQQSLKPSGHSIQVRIYAEDPLANFQPSSGRITHFQAPHCRVETWVESGSEVSPFYDPLLAKFIVHAPDRKQAVEQLQSALTESRLFGVENNIGYLSAIVADERFASGTATTAFLSQFTHQPHAAKVLEPGVLAILQQYPGRIGYWQVGVPPSGPMDALSFRLGNRILGNVETASGLECTVAGPKLQFLSPTEIAITGANMSPRVDGIAVPMWQPVQVPAGGVLELSTVEGPGARSYILVRGGFDAPVYLGSATTFTLGNFGGTTGRPLRPGDALSILSPNVASTISEKLPHPPSLTHTWTVGVLYGPHGAPDFFTDADVETFFATEWRVHHNSSRTGVRLIGPKPAWARRDGGDAGLHPSNIHDNAYAVGAIDFTGDMPVILGPDGPSLGGFVCPAVVVAAELWKIGQLKSGDTVRFQPITANEADQIVAALTDSILSLNEALPGLPTTSTIEPAIVRQHSPSVATRVSGDRYLLVEFGEPMLDLNLRIRAHALMASLEHKAIDGIIDLTPGIRSLQIHYDSSIIDRDRLLSLVDQAIQSAPNLEDFTIPSRTVHLPLSWDDPATRLAIERYMAGVRPDAPWCPSNLEFIRRINGLNSIDDVFRIVFSASYLVLGLGDVYLGAPVATPIDPRHRLVTTKYNPARTWTPENAVGIGGAYLCVYGMEGPGGYQFVGRTIQMWNTFRSTKDFEPGKPWLLRFFDQIRFFPVTAEELLDLRRDFPLGRYELTIDNRQFSVRDYHQLLHSIKAETHDFRSRQQQAFAEERQRWIEKGQRNVVEPTETSQTPVDEIPHGCAVITAPATASVWRLETSAGDKLDPGTRVLVLEAMKMEIAISAPKSGRVVKVLCEPGSVVSAGQPLIIYEAD